MRRTEDGDERRTPRHAVLAAAGGALAFLLVLVLHQRTSSHALLLIAAATAVVLAPTARRLSRRIALNLSLTLGWVPAFMWLPSSPFGVGEGAIAVATAAGATAAAVIRWPDRVRPVVRGRDGILVVAGALAGVVARPLASPSSPESALSMLTLGWDQASHFSMYLEQRLTRTAPPFLPASVDGTGEYFSTYPQWFHSLLAVLADAAHGPAGTTARELMAYSTLQWVVFVAVAITVVAALIQSLEDVSAGRLVAACAVALSLMVAVPGGLNLMQGHLNFLIAAVAPALIALLARTKVAPSSAESVAVLGLVVVAASWMLVLPLAVVAGWPAARRARLVRRGAERLTIWAFAAAAGALTTYLVLRSLGMLQPAVAGGTSGPNPLTLDGPVISIRPWVTFLLLGAACAWALASWRRGSLDAHPLNLLLLSTAALAQAAALATYLHLTTGVLTYYFWKLSLGLLLAVGLVVSQAWAASARQGSAGASHPVRGPMAGLLVAAVALLGLGVALRVAPAPSVLWAQGVPALLAERASSTTQAAALLSETAGLDRAQAARTVFLATLPDDLSPAYGQAWFHTLARARTAQAGTYYVDLYLVGQPEAGPDAAIDLARRVLDDGHARLVVTDPQLMRQLAAVLDEDDRSRVTLAGTGAQPSS